jgi:hypothetical protein
MRLGKIGELIQLIKIMLNGMNINVNGWKKMRIFKKKKKKKSFHTLSNDFWPRLQKRGGFES